MQEFFDNLAEIFTFQTQIYVFIGTLLVLLLLCFILLMIVGSKCKKLEKRVDALEEAKTLINDEEPKAAPAEEPVEPETTEAEEPKEEAGDKAAEPEAKEVPDAEEDVAPEAEEAADDGESVDDEETAEEKPEEVAAAAVMLDEQKAFNETIENEINELKEKSEMLAKSQRKSFDKIKVVRYSSTLPDGSETTGYSIGITNQDNDGIVLTGTDQAGGGTALVVKSVKGGVSKVPLTPAEDCAVKRSSK